MGGCWADSVWWNRGFSSCGKWGRGSYFPWGVGALHLSKKTHQYLGLRIPTFPKVFLHTFTPPCSIPILPKQCLQVNSKYTARLAVQVAG